jgi:CRP/FNR family transcriptional regulator, cyclic AMP receptor protein
MPAASCNADISTLCRAVQSLQGEGAFPVALSATDWQRLAPYLVRRELPAGSLLMRRGDSERTAYWVQEGQLQVYVVGGPPGSHRIALLAAGTIVGEPALFGAAPRLAHVEALTDAVVWGLGAESFDALAAQDTALALAVLRGAGAVMATRLRANLERGIPLS